MIKIEYETADRLPHMVKVDEKDALNELIKITAEGGTIRWVEKL